MKSTNSRQMKSHRYSFLSSKTEMDELVASYNWSETSLGPIESWPQSLQTSINIILNSPVPMVVLWGRDGIMIYNQSYSEFAGARHPALFGSKVLKGWPEVADFNRHVMAECLQGRTLSYLNQQLSLKRNNVAEEVWMNLNYSPICDESGKPAGVLAVVVETTERVQAETKQKRAESIAAMERQKLQRLFTDAPAYIAVLHGPDHIFTMANQRYLQIVGNRSIIGKPIRKALPEIKGTGLYEVMDKVYATGEPYIGNAVPISLDQTGNGKTKLGYFNFVYQPVRDENGMISDIFIHAVDVTDQLTAQHNMIEAKRMFDALFDSTVVAIALADVSGNILKANKTFLKLFGYTKAEFERGITSKQLTAPTSTKVTDSIYESLSRTGEAEPTAKKYIRKDGTEFPALVGGAMLPESDDQFMAFILDTTEIEKLKELNRVKDDFIALASHQLRTPATSVKQYIGILMEGYAGDLTAEQREFLSVANNSNNRQLSIIDDLLKTAQIDSAGYRLNVQPSDIVDILEQTMSHYAPVLETKDQRFDYTKEQSKIIIPVDPLEMSICIANLLENASKYSPNKKTISVRIKKTKTEVEIIVSDQGVGISEQDQTKVFDKFTRINNELSDTVNGNGLGLYWVKKIIDLHNGTIAIESAIGKGTSFILQLPV